MVGIVIVSHSAALGEGVRELAGQMVQGKVPLAVAAGIDDLQQPIGTDAIKVLEAIQAVYSEDGVIIFMDLGSALLSAETALDFLEPEQRAHIYLSSAPLVEGVMAAAVQASIGSSPDEILREAAGSLSIKADQLGETPPPAGEDFTSPLRPSYEESQEMTLIIPNKLGLHARPAAQFVSTAGEFLADILVYKGDRSANAKSINQVALLGARQGDEIRIVASGEDAQDALSALQVLADDNFGDSDELLAEEAETPAAPSAEGILTGIAASPGIAIGPVALYRPVLPAVQEYEIDDPQGEWERLQLAVDEAVNEIYLTRNQAEKQISSGEAAIFEAHALMLRDPELVDAVRALIFAERINAEAAWQRIVTATAAGYRDLDSPYMRARAVDVGDVGRRVLHRLLALELPSLEFNQPSILLAVDLTPSDTARLDPEFVLGICTELGGATSHSAILARALGIPAIVGFGSSIAAIPEAQVVALDGATGQLWTNPKPAQLAELRKRQAAQKQEKQEAQQASRLAAVTRDGHGIEIAANISRPQEIPTALEYGAEGVGLFRTEFLFLDRREAPDEEEQFEAYRQAADGLRDLPLIIRTLDVGGDKPLPYIDLGHEDNPFLGWRGIRFCLDNPQIFEPQIRAILRAGYERSVKLMFPMISTVSELRAAKAMVNRVKSELRAGGIPFDSQMETGIMIEVPAAVAIADLLAREVEFFSIGTNDLTQYVMAAERGNSSVSNLAQALNPAVLRLIDQTVKAAHNAGIWVGMCGELAGSAQAATLLVGLGLDELSMSAPSIPAVKSAIRGASLSDARRLAGKVLQLDTVEAVTECLLSHTA